MIAALVLAAGEGSRFADAHGGGGNHKLLQDISGAPLIARTLSAVLAHGFDQTLVVVSLQATEIEQAVRSSHPDNPAMRFLHNPSAHAGHMTSLKLGLTRVDEGCSAAMVFLADMPLVSQTVITALRTEFEKSGRLVVPECEGQYHHPRVIPRRFFPDFLELEDDEKGTVVFQRHEDEVAVVSVGEPHEFLDVDRREDLVFIRRHCAQR